MLAKIEALLTLTGKFGAVCRCGTPELPRHARRPCRYSHPCQSWTLGLLFEKPATDDVHLDQQAPIRRRAPTATPRKAG